MIMTMTAQEKKKNVRSERIAIQVTQDEKKAIEELAESRGLNMSAYVRLVLSDLANKK